MRLLTLVVALLATTLSFAQNDFEGTIDYEIKYEDLSDEIKPMEAMLPKEMTFEVKDKMSKMTQPNAMGGETIVITDIEAKESMVLMNMMGQKIAIKKSTEEDTKEDAPKPEIEYSDETKEIAGYECKKAIIVAEDGSEAVIFYTQDLPNLKVSDQAEYIDGFPMEITMTTEMFTSITTVTEVKEEKVKKIKMDVPDDYQLKTQEEFKQMMGGGGM